MGNVVANFCGSSKSAPVDGEAPVAKPEEIQSREIDLGLDQAAKKDDEVKATETTASTTESTAEKSAPPEASPEAVEAKKEVVAELKENVEEVSAAATK